MKVTKALEKFFDKTQVSRLAKRYGFVLRKARKITAYNFVVGFLLQCSKGVNTFSEWARQVGFLGAARVTRQAVWDRLHEGTVAFCEALLKKALLKRAVTTVKGSLFAGFKRVILQDSTTLHLPDGLQQMFPGNWSKGVRKAVARIQSILEVKTMQFLSFALEAFSDNDQGRSASILSVVNKGDLLIRDLGYFSLRVFEELTEAGVDFISRLRYGVTLWDLAGRPICLNALLKKGKVVDRWVYLGTTQRLKVRVVMMPLPQGQTAEKVRRAKGDRDRRLNHSKEYYRWLGYSVFITTVDNDTLRAPQVAEAYAVRWQIEIVFKSWKSSFHMQSLLHEACTGAHRAKICIYLLLLFICLFMHKVYMRYRHKVEKDFKKAVSLVKLSALYFRNMVEMLTLSPQKLKQLIATSGCYEIRKDRINMSELIHSF